MKYVYHCCSEVQQLSSEEKVGLPTDIVLFLIQQQLCVGEVYKLCVVSCHKALSEDFSPLADQSQAVGHHQQRLLALLRLLCNCRVQLLEKPIAVVLEKLKGIAFILFRLLTIQIAIQLKPVFFLVLHAHLTELGLPNSLVVRVGDLPPLHLRLYLFQQSHQPFG